MSQSTSHSVEKAEETDPLSPQEQKDLNRHEAVLRSGYETMEKMALALRDIQQRRLYRGKFRTFAAYVKTQWDMCIRRAYQLCDFAGVIENLRVHNCAQIPTREAHSRELARLPAEDQPKVWTAVLSDGKPTAAAIARKGRAFVIDVESEKVASTPTEAATPVDGTVHPIEPVAPCKEGPDVEDRNDFPKAGQRLIEIWDQADQQNRRAFLRYAFPKPRIELKRAIEAACRVKYKRVPLSSRENLN